MPMNNNRKIRVLVVDDSMLARKLIMEGLSKYPNIEIVGYAINAMDAKRKLAQLNPDVMTCDVQMPGMSGIELLKELIPENPLPVVLVSSLNLRVFDALHAGAVDLSCFMGRILRKYPIRNYRRSGGIRLVLSFRIIICSIR